MKRKKYIVGNWKMFKTVDSAYNDFLILQTNLENYSHTTHAPFHIGVCAPSVFLQQIADLSNNIHIFAQNVHWEKEGAFTGEISVPMLQSICVEGSLVAHSERRQYFNETNETAGKKLKALLQNKMRAIYCVGESLSERENNKVEEVIQTQLEEALEICKTEVLESEFENYLPLSIAYEPVWAIGTGKAATLNDAKEVHIFIRKILAKMFGQEIADKTRVLYGGSVKLSNAKEFLADEEIDGALVGGASLNPKEFFDLCLCSPNA